MNLYSALLVEFFVSMEIFNNHTKYDYECYEREYSSTFTIQTEFWRISFEMQKYTDIDFKFKSKVQSIIFTYKLIDTRTVYTKGSIRIYKEERTPTYNLLKVLEKDGILNLSEFMDNDIFGPTSDVTVCSILRSSPSNEVREDLQDIVIIFLDRKIVMKRCTGFKYKLSMSDINFSFIKT